MASIYQAPARAPAPAPIAAGDKLYVAEIPRESSNRRHHFAGEVTGLSDDIVRLAGYEFVYDEPTGNFERKPWLSERILRLDNAMVFYVLPGDCVLENLTHERNGQELVITDGGAFRLVDRKYSGR
ncbi:MAG: hypothetical protein OEO83_00335 [Alphaproteobacteria bacterium]|nr:hypothetical protein [Alphaproteobacteria bacterium]